MKKINNRITKSLSIASIVFSLVFTGCNSFNVPIKNYFKEYTETAAVMIHELPREDYPVDKDGYISIPSDSDFKITGLLRNPQLYALDFAYGFADETIIAKTNTYIDGKNVKIPELTQSDDLTKVEIVFPSEYLRYTEMGDDISGTLTLYEPKSGRWFNPYELKFRSNSQPEPVRNLSVIQDNTNSVYVLSFNMPDMTGIHNDISSITLCGKTYAVDTTGIGRTGTGIAFGTAGYEKFYSAVPAGSDWSSGASGAVVSKGDRTVYYLTDIPFKEDAYTFDVTLEDSKGLTMLSEVTQNSRKLSPVPELEQNSFDAESDGYSYFDLLSPQTDTEGDRITTDDVYVYYKLYAYDNANKQVGNLIKEGFGLSKVTVAAGNGFWYYETWAHKKNYIDSDTTYSNITSQGYVYVNSAYDGAVSDGGKNSPYKTIEAAIQSSVNAGFDQCKINLLSDVTLAAPVTMGSGAGGCGVNLFVSSKDKFTVTGTFNLPADTFLEIIGNPRFEGSGSAPAISMDSGSIVKTKNITGGEASDYIASIKYNGSLKVGTVLIESADGTAISDLITDRIALMNNGYYVGTQDGKGVLAVSGIQVQAQIPGLSYTLTVSGITEIMNGNTSTGVYTIVPGSEITVTRITNNSTQDVVYTSLVKSIQLYSGSTSVLSSSTKSLTVPAAIPSGKYWLEITFVDAQYLITASYLINIPESGN